MHRTQSTHSRTTVALCTILHAFTHAYGTMLVPMYLLIVQDLKLPGIKAASLIVTVYGMVYFLGSYGAGVLADRLDRKRLLSISLIGNAGAVALMGLTRSYEMLLAFAVVAGLFGTLFHPAANALVPAHFPRHPGMAIGVMGMGAGLGFFAGPQYAGWRAETVQWRFGDIANWQWPCIELGLLGVLMGLIFLVVGREVRRKPPKVEAALHPPLGKRLRWRVAAVAAVLAWRDFSGVALLSLTSIYLLRAHDLDAKRTGFILGAMMLISFVVNPIAIYFSGGTRRLPTLSVALIVAGLIAATIPHWPLSIVLPVLCLFQASQLGSYALSDAAILERVDPAVRGRVVGILLTIAGSVASLAPWIMGAWTDGMGIRAEHPRGYVAPFAAICACQMVSAFAAPLIARLGAPNEHAIEPISEISPATMEPIV